MYAHSPASSAAALRSGWPRWCRWSLWSRLLRATFLRGGKFDAQSTLPDILCCTFSHHTQRRAEHALVTVAPSHKPPWCVTVNHNGGSCWSVWLRGHKSNTYLFIYWSTTKVDGFLTLFCLWRTLREENKRCFCAVFCRFTLAWNWYFMQWRRWCWTKFYTAISAH